MNKGDWLLFIGFLLLNIAVVSFAYYMFTEKINDCTADPLKFAVEKIRVMYDVDHVYGEMRVVSIYPELKQKSWRFGDEYDILNLSK